MPHPNPHPPLSLSPLTPSTIRLHMTCRMHNNISSADVITITFSSRGGTVVSHPPLTVPEKQAGRPSDTDRSRQKTNQKIQKRPKKIDPKKTPQKIDPKKRQRKIQGYGEGATDRTKAYEIKTRTRTLSPPRTLTLTRTLTHQFIKVPNRNSHLNPELTNPNHICSFRSIHQGPQP